MGKKIYANVNGKRVEVGEVVGYSNNDNTEEFNLRLDLIPTAGEFTLVIEKSAPTHGTLRVRNVHKDIDPKYAYTEPKIDATKAYREVFGVGLGEAKARMYDNGNPTKFDDHGPWGRPAWDYALTADEVQRLLGRQIPLKSTITGGGFPLWEIILF